MSNEDLEGIESEITNLNNENSDLKNKLENLNKTLKSNETKLKMEVDKTLKEMKNELKEHIQSEMGVFKRMLEAINGVFETDSRVCRKDGLNDGLKRYHKNR